MMWLVYLLTVAIAAVLGPSIASAARGTASVGSTIECVVGAGIARGAAADAHQWRSRHERPLVDRDDLEVDLDDDDTDEDADGDAQPRLVGHPAVPHARLRSPCGPDRASRHQPLGDPSSLAFGWGLPRGPPTV